MAALLANINMFTTILEPSDSAETPILGKEGWGNMSEYIGTYEPGSSTQAVDSHGIPLW